MFWLTYELLEMTKINIPNSCQHKWLALSFRIDVLCVTIGHEKFYKIYCQKINN